MITKAEISLIRSLSDKRGRAQEGLFAAEGAKLIGELLSSGMEIARIYATETAGIGFAASRGPNAASGTMPLPDRDIRRISPAEMKRISSLRTPTDIVALVKIPSHVLNINKDDLVLCLDNVQDPGNLGTIIRLADWFGIRDMICSPGTADCFNPKVVQATMGAISRVRVHYSDIPRFLSGISTDTPVYGTFLDGENIYGSQLSQGGVIVLGNEGNGISAGVGSLVTRRIYIPPFPPGQATVESLNVAVATAIVCSEFRRRL